MLNSRTPTVPSGPITDLTGLSLIDPIPTFREIYKIIPGYAIIRCRYNMRVWDEKVPLPRISYYDDDENEDETGLTAC